MSSWSPSNHHVELPAVHHGYPPPAAAGHSQERHCYGNAIVTPVSLSSSPHSLRVIRRPGYVHRLSTSLPVATLLWSARLVAVSTSTTCSLACTVVAMETMRKVCSPVLACDGSILCLSVSLTSDPLFQLTAGRFEASPLTLWTSWHSQQALIGCSSSGASRPRNRKNSWS